MPTRNLLKNYGAEQFYHVYSRGVAKQAVFLDDEDFRMFLSFFKRYLSADPVISPQRHPYPNYASRVELLAYCLMPNHIHLLFYQNDATAISELMRSLMTSYSMYFNRKYKRVGPVFQSRYLASNIDQESYLEHISRYIHLNPKAWRTYEYSSLPYYLGQRQAEWLKPARILEIFDNNQATYRQFVEDYEANKQLLDELKHELAHE
jgi:putative transposase